MYIYIYTYAQCSVHIYGMTTSLGPEKHPKLSFNNAGASKHSNREIQCSPVAW